MVRFVVLILILFVSLPVNAQMQLTRYDTEKGMPSNMSEAILRDSHGFLWIGTYNGLSKYDGAKFQNYPITDSSNGVYGSTVFKVFENSKQQLWIGTHKGLSNYDKINDKFNLVIKNICVLDIDESKDGMLWVSTFSGIIVIDPLKAIIIKKYDSPKTLPSNIITQCVIDSSGLLWFSTQTDGLFTLNPQTNKIQRIVRNAKLTNTLSSNRIKSIVFDKNGMLWIGTSDAGISVFNPLKQQFILFKKSNENQRAASNRISNIYVDSKNDVWYCCDGKVNRYNRALNSFIEFSPEKYNDRFFQYNNICFITEDNDGNFWFGSYGSGIYCLNKQQNIFNIITSIPDKPYYLKNNVVYAFVEHGDKIIVGSEGGLQYYNPKANTFSDFENKILANRSVWSVSKFNNELWCSSWEDGLYRLDLKSNKLIHYFHNDNDPSSLLINNIRSTAMIDNRLWIATWGEGLETFDKTYSKIILHEEITNKSSIFKNPSWVCSIFEDSKNRVWISTMFGLYLKQDKSYKGYFNDTKNKSSLSDDIVFSVFEDSKHQIWVVANNGINKYKEKTDDFECFSKEKDFPANPTAILEDKNQNLWISAIDGLYSFNESTSEVRKYDHRNGLLKAEFNYNAALKSSDGTLYFGCKSGFIRFNPEQFKPIFNLPKIVCRYLSLDNIVQKSIESSDSLYLNYSEAVVSIDVVDIKDIVSNLATFKYSFDGEKNWKTIDETRRISFSNKEPGIYLLHIKATYDNKKYSKKTLTIIVIPPWWMTWWFRITCLILILLFLYAFFKIRIRIIQNQNDHLTSLVKEKTQNLVDANEELLQQNTAIAEKEMLLQIRNDELQKSSITKDKLFSIISKDLKKHFSGIMENAKNLNISKSLKTEKEKQVTIESIYNSSKKVNAQIDLFLNWSNSQTKNILCNAQNVAIETLVRETILLNSNNAFNKQIDMQFVFEHRNNAFVDEEMITIALRNIVSNALKYTHNNGTILIQTSNSIDYTIIQVKDTGVGMNQNQINDIYTNTVNESTIGTNNETGTGLGLVICRDFLNLNKAKIEIVSQPNIGTTVSMFLPKGNSIKEISGKVIIDKKLDEDNNIPIYYDELESKLRLLIVEDNEEILEYIVGIFEPYYIVEIAKNGEEGFTKAIESIPDLIITDINMPVKNGIEMCLQIQAEPILNHIPIIILSAFSTIDMQEKGLQAGAFDFVVKPFDRTILFLKVQSLLESRAKFKEYLKRQFIQQPKSVFKETPDDKFMMKMQEILETHFADSGFSVEKFSSEMGYSRSQFFRKLKAIIDTTPLEYLNVFRLKKAKEMIEHGSWTVSEVAYDVGFNDPHYFSICFKNHFGFPPNHFLKNKS